MAARHALAALLTLTASCSFIGAYVPHTPPAPAHCPEGVVMLDVAVTGLTLLPAAAVFIMTDYNRDPGAFGAIVIGVPLAIVGVTYLSSTVYGFRARARCERMKQEEAEAFTVERPAARQPIRDKVIGDDPVYCAITEPDVGACFFDAGACSAEAARSAIACETRTSAFCFDVSHSAVPRSAETTCAASLLDCDARRLPFAGDATLIVTRCGPYAVRAAQPADAEPPP